MCSSRCAGQSVTRTSRRHRSISSLWSPAQGYQSRTSVVVEASCSASRDRCVTSASRANVADRQREHLRAGSGRSISHAFAATVVLEPSISYAAAPTVVLEPIFVSAEPLLVQAEQCIGEHG